MKKYLSLLLVLILFLSSLPVYAYDESYIYEDYKYEIMKGYNKYISITDYLGPGGHISLPSYIYNDKHGEDLPVATVSIGAFMDKNLTGLGLPHTLEVIGPGAFQNNKITYLSLPATVHLLGDHAFDNAGLENLDLWPGYYDLAYGYGDGVFANNKLRSVSLPDDFDYIFHDLFYGNEPGLILYGSPESKAKEIADKYGYIYKGEARGAIFQDPHSYYYDDNGHRLRGWDKTPYGTYYYDQETGEKKFDFQIIDGKKYYFGSGSELQIDSFAQEGHINRTAGDDRYKTAVEVSKLNYKQANVVVLAQGADFPDALAGASLAGIYAPVLLTSKRGLPSCVEGELERLKVVTVLALGGPGAIPQAQLSRLKNLGYNVERIAGKDRYETAAEIAIFQSQLGSSSAFMSSGGSFPDALAIGPVAAKKAIPILLTSKDKIPKASLDALSHLGVQQVTLVGGTSVISSKVEDQLRALGIKVDRVAGKDRYDTSVEIAKKYFSTKDAYGFNEVIVAAGNGQNFADALVAGYMGGLRGAPILLTSDKTISKTVLNYLAAKKPGVHIVGGGSVVSKSVSAAINPNCSLADHCHINIGSTLGHDVNMDDYVTIMPGANISGNVKIGTYSMVGTGAVILQGLEIEENSTLGAGAVIIKDTKKDSTYVGVPAKKIK